MQRLVHSHKLFTIKIIVLLLLNIFLCSLPDWEHTVKSFGFCIILILRFFAVLGFFLNSAVSHIHHNRIADIVGILLDKSLDSVLLKELIIVFFLCIVLNFKYNCCTDFVPLCFGDFVTVCAVRFPLVSCVTAVFLSNNGNFLCYHKSGVKTDAELTDNVNIVLLFAHFLLKLV